MRRKHRFSTVLAAIGLAVGALGFGAASAGAALAANSFGLSTYINGSNIKLVARRGGTATRIFVVQYLW